MKSFGINIALTLLVARLGVATECNKSNAKAWPTSGVAVCMGNTECIAIVLSGQCNASGLSDSQRTQCMKSQKRATLDCTSSETCWLYTDGDLLCHNRATGNYHDDKGGNGNTNNGVYTYADGQVVTNPGTGTFTRPSTSTKKTTSTTTGATTTRLSTTTTSAGAVVSNTVAAVQTGSTTTTAAATRSSGLARPSAAVAAKEVLLSVGGFAVACAALL